MRSNPALAGFAFVILVLFAMTNSVQAADADTYIARLEELARALESTVPKKPAKSGGGGTDFMVNGNPATQLADDDLAPATVYASHLRSIAGELKGKGASEVVARLGIEIMPGDIQTIVFGPRENSDATTTTTLLPYVLGNAGASVAHPPVAALVYDRQNDGRTIQCTATLVDSRVLVSAAHCFCDLAWATGKNQRDAASCRSATYSMDGRTTTVMDDKRWQVFFHRHGIFNISKIQIHDDYAWPLADLAVIELEHAPEITPAELYSGPSPQAGAIGTIVGFGMHSTFDRSGNPTGTRVAPNSVGLKLEARVATASCPAELLQKNLICWDYDATTLARGFGSTCSGDSGGPFFLRSGGELLLAGVTSGGDGSCLPGAAMPSFDVDLSHYRDWIAGFRENASGRSVLERRPTTDMFSTKFWSIERETWEGKFVNPTDQGQMLVTINMTSQHSSSEFYLKHLESAKLYCNEKSPDAIKLCSVASPPKGNWTLGLATSSRAEFQAIVAHQGPD